MQYWAAVLIRVDNQFHFCFIHVIVFFLPINQKQRLDDFSKSISLLLHVIMFFLPISQKRRLDDCKSSHWETRLYIQVASFTRLYLKMEETHGVKLFGFWVSPFVQRVKWALKLKGIEYEYIEEDIYNKSSFLLKLNPVHGLVPVLVHDGKPVSESIVILEYIDEVWKGTPLLPKDPYERAQARFWAKFVEEKVRQSAREALCSRGDERERAIKSSIEALEKIEEEIKQKGKKYFGGETIGFVDLVAGFIAYQLPVFDEVASMKILDSSKFPAIFEWINNFLSHPLINEDLPSKDRMFAYIEKRRKELADQKLLA